MLSWLKQKFMDKERHSPQDTGKKLLWYPMARNPGVNMATAGRYTHGYPVGAVVHHTAGASGMSSIEWAKKQGYAFLLIDRDGTVYQAHPLDRWGSHAGSSFWPSLGTGLSSKLVGIEVAAAGKVKDVGSGQYQTYWGKQLPKERVRVLHERRDRFDVAGSYEAATAEQEESLIELLCWLKLNGPDIFDCNNILGHMEISPGRKDDPSGTLSMSMSELRELIKQKTSL